MESTKDTSSKDDQSNSLSLKAILASKLFGLTMRCLLYYWSFLMVLVFVLLKSWGIGTFPSFDRNVRKLNDLGLFLDSPLIDAEGVPTMLRYARDPVGRVLHFLPTALWSIIAPFQLSPAWRSKYRTAHRWLGRLFIGMSTAIAIGVPRLLWTGVTKADYGVMTGGASLAIAAYFLVTGLQAVRYARNKHFAAHRVWILRHVAAGYSVHAQRMVMMLTQGSLHLFVPQYRDKTQEGSDVRSVVFITYSLLSFGACMIAMEIWLRYSSYAWSSPKEQQKVS